MFSLPPVSAHHAPDNQWCTSLCHKPSYKHSVQCRITRMSNNTHCKLRKYVFLPKKGVDDLYLFVRRKDPGRELLSHLHTLTARASVAARPRPPPTHTCTRCTAYICTNMEISSHTGTSISRFIDLGTWLIMKCADATHAHTYTPLTRVHALTHPRTHAHELRVCQ